MIAPTHLPEIPDHVAVVITRYAQASGRTYEAAAIHLLATMGSLWEKRENGEIEGLCVRKKDGTVDEVLF